MNTAQEKIVTALDSYPAGFSMTEASVFTVDRGLQEGVVRKISLHKKEPDRMLGFHLNPLKPFNANGVPSGA